MIISIQQPEHLPWLGYFDKFRQVDLVVFLDNVQFKKRYFENRNRIRNKNGEIWLTVPVKTKGRYTQRIMDVEIDNTRDWRRTIWQTLIQEYKCAPFWEQYADYWKEYYQRDWDMLVDMNIEAIQWIATQLGVSRPTVRSSTIETHGNSTELLVSICQSMGAHAYLSGAFGRDYLDSKLFDQAGIELRFQDFHHPTYTQLHEPFVPGMSSIDFLFNEGPKWVALYKESEQ